MTFPVSNFFSNPFSLQHLCIHHNGYHFKCDILYKLFALKYTLDIFATKKNFVTVLYAINNFVRNTVSSKLYYQVVLLINQYCFCDFYLWGHLKNELYAMNSHTLEELEAIIRREFD